MSSAVCPAPVANTCWAAGATSHHPIFCDVEVPNFVPVVVPNTKFKASAHVAVEISVVTAPPLIINLLTAVVAVVPVARVVGVLMVNDDGVPAPEPNPVWNVMLPPDLSVPVAAQPLMVTDAALPANVTPLK